MNRWTLTGAFIATILFADWLAGLAPTLLLHLGPIAVPWGTPFIGIALALRDTIQRWYGLPTSRRAIWWAATASVGFAAGGGTPWRIIGASAAAFLVSEAIDLIAYTALRPPSQTARIGLSCLLSAPFDSLIFVWIAFSLDWGIVGGQTLVKLLGVAVYLGGRLLVDRWAPARAVQAQT